MLKRENLSTFQNEELIKDLPALGQASGQGRSWRALTMLITSGLLKPKYG
jgi:hypothetical protein